MTRNNRQSVNFSQIPVRNRVSIVKKISEKGLWHEDRFFPCRNMSETAFLALLQTGRGRKRCFCVLPGGSEKENNVTGLFREKLLTETML